MNAGMRLPAVRRIDPRRPAVITPQGLRRIVLGSEVGERGGPPAALSATKPLRSAGPFTGCIAVVAHVDGGVLDEHAREVLAAATVLARPQEAVLLLAIGACTDDLAACGVDEAQLLSGTGAYAPQALADAVHAHVAARSPRHVLMADRGADADLGRRLAVRSGWPVASHVVEWHDGRVRVRGSGGTDLCAVVPALALLERGVASSELPYLGHGRAAALSFEPQADPAVVDLGLDAGDPQRLALDEAEFIIAAGNGVTDVSLFQDLARALGAAMGASRVAVDDGRFPRSRQIGATGTTVSARGYLAFGISGATQHLQGIKDVRHVLAVNTDAAAPIAQRAELTVVADAQATMRALLALATRTAPGVTP